MPDQDEIFSTLRTIPDPEMPISIVDLGLVERVEITPGPSREVSETGQRIGDSPSPLPSPKGRGSVVHIDILPTFIGCPALEMIANEIREKVGALDGVDEVSMRFLHDPPWSVDRITATGREQLRAHGVTVPDRGSRLEIPGHRGEAVALRTSAVNCPFCASDRTRLESSFGPTRCRMIYYCDECRNSFEHMKRV